MQLLFILFSSFLCQNNLVMELLMPLGVHFVVNKHVFTRKRALLSRPVLLIMSGKVMLVHLFVKLHLLFLQFDVGVLSLVLLDEGVVYLRGPIPKLLCWLPRVLLMRHLVVVNRRVLCLAILLLGRNLLLLFAQLRVTHLSLNLLGLPLFLQIVLDFNGQVAMRILVHILEVIDPHYFLVQSS